MVNTKEEWQSTDSGYLNCIGVGDTYVKRQMERILGENYLKADLVTWWHLDNGIEANIFNPQFVNKDDNNC